MSKPHVSGIPLPLRRCEYCRRDVHMVCRNAADMVGCADDDPVCDATLRAMLARWTNDSAKSPTKRVVYVPE